MTESLDVIRRLGVLVERLLEPLARAASADLPYPNAMGLPPP